MTKDEAQRSRRIFYEAVSLKFFQPMTQTLRNLLRMIKFPHTVFALPFALMGALLAEKRIPPVDKLLWILLAMVSARTAAMTLNRIVDSDLDAINPSTAQREIP